MRYDWDGSNLWKFWLNSQFICFELLWYMCAYMVYAAGEKYGQVQVGRALIKKLPFEF